MRTMIQGPSASRQEPAWWKRLLFSLLILIVVILIAELCMRAVFAFMVGPSVLLYGTPFHRRQVDSETPSSGGNGERQQNVKEIRASMTTKEWRMQRTVWDHSNKRDGYSKYFRYQQRFDFDIDTGQRFEASINRSGLRGENFAAHKESRRPVEFVSTHSPLQSATMPASRKSRQTQRILALCRPLYETRREVRNR